MKAVGLGRRATALVALAALIAACDGGGTGGPVPTTAVAASPTAQTALVGTAVTSAPSVRVTDQQGQPMPDVAVTFVVSAGGGTLTGGSATTNASGVATAGTWTLGTTPGQNTVTATAGSLTPVVFTATAQGRAPTTITAVSATTQSALAGTAVAQAPTVRVNDQTGQPLAGATVTFAVTSGGGQVGSATAVTGANGEASAGSWTLGINPGQNTVSATVAGLSAVTFTATGVDPCEVAVAYTLFSTIQASLAASDCRVEGDFFTDLYTVTLPSAQMVEFRMSSTEVDAWLELYDGLGNFVAGNDDDVDTDAVLRVFAPTGNYLVAASSAFSEEVGPYQLSSATFNGNQDCQEYWVVPSLEIQGSIETTDCADALKYGDFYLLVLRAGQTLTLRMSSAGIDPLMELYNSDLDVVASDDDSGGGTTALITYTVPQTDIYLLNATTFGNEETGPYTLLVTRN